MTPGLRAWLLEQFTTHVKFMRVWRKEFRPKRVATTGDTTTYTFKRFTVRAETLSMMSRERWEK